MYEDTIPCASSIVYGWQLRAPMISYWLLWLLNQHLQVIGPPHLFSIWSAISRFIGTAMVLERICFDFRLAWQHSLLIRGFINSRGGRGLEQIEVEIAGPATNFADEIAALRSPLGSSVGAKPPRLKAGAWEAPASEHEEKAACLTNSGCINWRQQNKWNEWKTK